MADGFVLECNFLASEEGPTWGFDGGHGRGSRGPRVKGVKGVKGLKAPQGKEERAEVSQQNLVFQWWPQDAALVMKKVPAFRVRGDRQPVSWPVGKF